MKNTAYVLWAIGVIAAIGALFVSADISILVNDGVYLSYVGYTAEMGRIGPFLLILSPTAFIIGAIFYVGSKLSR